MALLDFNYARTHPGQLAAGLAVGLLSTVFTCGLYWPFAPVFPLILTGMTMASRCTNAFSAGAFAAFLGLSTFMLVLGVVVTVVARI